MDGRFLRLRGLSRTNRCSAGVSAFPGCAATGFCADLSLGAPLGRRLLVSDNLKFLDTLPHFNFTLANNFSRQQKTMSCVSVTPSIARNPIIAIKKLVMETPQVLLKKFLRSRQVGVFFPDTVSWKHFFFHIYTSIKEEKYNYHS